MADPKATASPTIAGAAPSSQPAPIPREKPRWARVLGTIFRIIWPPAHPKLPPNARSAETGTREIVETVVFVVVLVLLLKSFAAEAFVIPTGSMATTLLGYHKEVTCPSCGYTFVINCSSEVDPQDGKEPQHVSKCFCENCLQRVKLLPNPQEQRAAVTAPASSWRDEKEVADPGWRSGDRVLVAKFMYEAGRGPRRLDVVVFKYPQGPQKNFVPINYIKRLLGLPGETIAIHGGDIYVLPPEDSPKYDDSALSPEDRRKVPAMHSHAARIGDINERSAPILRLFRDGKFRIVRKPPAVLLEMMRLVYDNDHPAQDLPANEWKRWVAARPKNGWSESGKSFDYDSGASEGRRDESPDWLEYHHRLRNTNRKAHDQLITDLLSYNYENLDTLGHNWVGDLIVECEVKVEQAQGEFCLQLSQGTNVYRASWDLSAATCSLLRVDESGKTEVLAGPKPSKLKPGSRHKLRFANVDQRLTVWVDGSLPFGDGHELNPRDRKGPTANDLTPAKIGCRGTKVRIDHVKLFRDTYYTVGNGKPGDGAHSGVNGSDGMFEDQSRLDWDWGTPGQWDRLRNLPVMTLYVQPGHYLCLGDNSPSSSDSRSWGLVPERLMLGRALMVYYPFKRAGRIR